jgi:hypothetical protein
MAHGRTRHNRTYKPIFIDITLGEGSIQMALEDYELEDGDEMGLDSQKLGCSADAASVISVKVRFSSILDSQLFLLLIPSSERS